MLVLSRMVDEKIKIHVAGGITLTIVEIRGNNVRVGIDAPKEVLILRSELEEKPKNDRKKQSKRK